MIRTLLFALLVLTSDSVRFVRAESLAESRSSVDAAFRSRFGALAEKWAERGNAVEAKQTRDWLIPDLDRRIVIYPLSRGNDSRGSRPQISAEWTEEFTALRKEYAAALFPLAMKFAKNEPAAVYRLLHEIVREDGDSLAARKALDHRLQLDKRWQTDLGGMPQVRAATTDHPTLGWKRGKYWRIESAHFQIATSHSAAEGQYLSEELERLHNAWRQIFFALIARPGALEARLAGNLEPLFKERQYKVVLFRDRDEYLATLGPKQPKIGLTTGIYFDGDQTSYFYAAGVGKRVADYPQLRTPWLHEVTHQLLHENLGGKPGENGNFWLVEGIATYLESLTYYPTYATLGGWHADRLQFARYRNLSGDRSWPLAKLLPLTKSQWQESAEIRRLYTQGAGLTALLMDGEQGRFREATLNFLLAIYRGTDRLEQLSQWTQRSYDELDATFLAYAGVSDEDIARFPPPNTTRNLALGLTKVTDQGLQRISVCRDLEWLDLTRLPITDEGLKVLGSFPKLKQLFLERTAATSASLSAIGKLKELEELDLTGWKISDDDLKSLAGLSKLKVLYLTDTPITDRGLLHLKPLRQLETLETEGTQVTSAGRKQLQLKGSR